MWAEKKLATGESVSFKETPAEEQEEVVEQPREKANPTSTSTSNPVPAKAAVVPAEVNLEAAAPEAPAPEAAALEAEKPAEAAEQPGNPAPETAVSPETAQAGGSSSQSSSSLLNELNYELHLSMYVQKLLKMLIYRYLNHAGMDLTYKEYMLEMFVNMVVFSVLNISNGDHFVCYLVDQMMIFIGMQIYLRIAQKENWPIDNNHLSAIILAPYYVVLC